MKIGVNFPGITVSYFCHDGNGNFLMQKRGVNCRDEHGNWDFGGGGVDFGDSVMKTLHKEIKEELGVNVLESEFLGYKDVMREHNGAKTHWVALHFKVLVDREKVKNNEPHKFDEIGWFTLNDLPEPLHSQIPNFLEEYGNKL